MQKGGTMETVLRQERDKRGWSRRQLAEMIGVTASQIYYLETGRRKPSYNVLVKLEDLFHKSHRQLFAAADETPPKA